MSDRPVRLVTTQRPAPVPPRRLSARRLGAAGLAAGVLAVAAMSVVLLLHGRGGGGGGAGSGPAADTRSAQAARGFLDRYVEPDGRVVRRDQGGDTVSEGQSYALLLAQAVSDGATFGRVWAWTAAHLLRPDGLLASHADAAHVIDPSPATDADLVTAWALLRARGDGAPAYHAAGRRLAAAILAHESVSAGGTPLLAAGPWATGTPATLNPSYWALPAYKALRASTGDARWQALHDGALAATRQLSSGGAALPPDWARVDGSAVTATASPNGQPPQVQYGLDAQRLVVWLAAACDPAARRLAAGWWPALSRPGAADAVALSQDGRVLAGGPSVLPLVAAAAAADAAGRGADRDRMLARAAAVDAAHPGYYGAAWVALGRMLLEAPGSTGCGGSGA